MSLLLANRALDVSIVGADVIKITMTPTASFLVGINLTFASGTLTIDWKDGSSTENFVSGVELTHTYVIAATYIAEITGDLENITKFIADNNRITGVVDFEKLIALEELNLGFNTSLSSIALPTLSTPLNALVLNNTGISVLNMANTPVDNAFLVNNCPNLTTLDFASTGNGKLVNPKFHDCNLSSMDFSNMAMEGLIWGYNNSNCTSFTIAPAGNGTFTSVRLYGCNLSSADFTNAAISTQLYLFNNTGLNSLTLAAVNGVTADVRIYNCDLPDQDFTTFATSDGVNIDMDNNSLTATEHDNQLINLDSTAWINGFLDILTGNTSRTAASDTAYNNLISNGWVIT